MFINNIMHFQPQLNFILSNTYSKVYNYSVLLWIPHASSMHHLKVPAFREELYKHRFVALQPEKYIVSMQQTKNFRKIYVMHLNNKSHSNHSCQMLQLDYANHCIEQLGLQTILFTLHLTTKKQHFSI